MPTALKAIIIGLMVLIVGIIIYIIYLYKKEAKKEASIPKEKKQKIIKNTKLQSLPNPAKDWEKDLLVNITKERLLRIQNSTTTKRLDTDELEVLSKIIEKKNDIKDWNELIPITKNARTYGILNIAILDHLYIILPKKEKTDEVVKTAYLLDLINDGIQAFPNETNYLPTNLDINATLINILNQDLQIEDRTNKLSIQTVKRACLELVSNGGYKDLNWAAKQVVSRIILDTIGNIIYKYENTEKLLSDENKIYLRLLGVIIGNKNYNEIVEEMMKN